MAASVAAYRLQVYSEQERFDTGRVESDQSVEVTVEGLALQPATIYQWTLTVWDSANEQAEAVSHFETGIDSFKAAWMDPRMAYTSLLLAMVGFDQTLVQQTGAVNNVLIGCVIIAPALLAIVGIVIFTLFYPITKEKLACFC